MAENGSDEPQRKKEPDHILLPGKPDLERCDNRVVSARYTPYSFIPVATLEQFRRFANLYFLTVGLIMAIGYYNPNLYESAISPWTTLGPLAVVIAFSLLVEGNADYKRHVNDRETNEAPCVILTRTDELDEETCERDTDTLKGRDVKVNINKAFYDTVNSSVQSDNQSTAPATPVNVHIAFQKVRRADIRQGHFVLIKNREMVPADVVLLASSNDGGSAYIETSSIDGETNLKLRNSPRLPKSVMAALRQGPDHVPSDLPPVQEENEDQGELSTQFETIREAVKRLTRFSYLGRPDAKSVLEHPLHKRAPAHEGGEQDQRPGIMTGLESSFRDFMANAGELTHRHPNPSIVKREGEVHDGRYIAALTTEPPNPSVHTFQGKLTLPPFDQNGDVYDLPLDAENVLLRGAVLRNTEWILGVAFFTGTDTKLVQNSFKTPSKFSQLDALMNKTVLVILAVMISIISYLATAAVLTNNNEFDDLWYAGFNTNTSEPWPYLPNLDPPQWNTSTNNWIQFFLLYVTLLTNFIPLSLYVTVEFITFCMLAFVYIDLNMYDDTTNTRAVARSTIVTDLGQIQYIFSDKTGTLTQNVMRFKRCSVDGMAFGAPIQKSRPQEDDDDEEEQMPFHPLRHLLIGKLQSSLTESRAKGSSSTQEVELIKVAGQRLTFNAEMFLRIMSLCHTVVQPRKSPDGAPYGYAYQAESPDEGALVSAASSIFGFQVVTRDFQGITIRVGKPSHLQDEVVVEGLKKGAVSLKKLAADSTFELPSDTTLPPETSSTAEREETWGILAVNKFDSDRKRMSVLLRSPPELGSLPILFCKGADSSMLDPSVCANPQAIERANSGSMGTEGNGKDMGEYDEWEISQMLGLQAQLGDFASEGLRTLVLGLRILTEAECEEWLEQYKAASVALTDRAALLTEAATAIETNLHIAGATAIEDKLQRGVPETIATLEKAGIKLWVLTGDKRETAVEIGYSTHVLTPKMHVTEVADQGKLHVQTQMCMEFLSLVKRGRLPDYQRAMVAEKNTWSCSHVVYGLKFLTGTYMRGFRRMTATLWACVFSAVGLEQRAERQRSRVARSLDAEAHIMKDVDRRRLVRSRAEATVKEWLESDEGKTQRRGRGDDELSMVTDETPDVFRKASSARSLLNDMRGSGRMAHSALREVSLAQLTAQQQGQGGDIPLVDEDTLSMNSFVPGNKEDLEGYFDKRRRTLLERTFAIDREVRKGKLRKHVKPEKLAAINENESNPNRRSSESQVVGGPRALVIEGAALKHLLGDPELEEILFSVAQTCGAVIACRVSPKQKALLVNLVRQNVSPTPITLAIGDGANDVGMIQEAHVGVGISGKEGKQAVNASDFAIAQFRFLEDLVLIHGRWDFFRLSTVVLFSFYKNAVLAGMLVTFSSQTVYSGTPLYDEWLIAMVNFVAGIPIIMTGLFDRCLSKEYVRRNPEVYKATRENELITFRTLLRWICMVFIHLFTLYYFTVPAQSNGGGMTSAFVGLMRKEPKDEPGNGEGGDLKSAGTVTFSCMIVLLAYKVLYETRSLIHGRWPAFTCRKGVGEGVWSRLAYTWIGVTYLSIGFYLIAISIYQVMGRAFVSSLSSFVDVTNHVLGTRSLSWMLIVFVPIFGMVFDVSLKVFSNMFYPTQTQIHMEIESREIMLQRKTAKRHGSLVNNKSAGGKNRTQEGMGDQIEL
ncbi:hypothetical protein ACA910_003065 [Epithemia clementina (nom. ined.)]